MIILDLGSGNSCRNSIDYACRMVKAVVDLSLPDVVIKWQLFKHEGDNVPLSLEVFERAYRYAALFGIATTASVFDKDSLDYLLTFPVPFVKLANKVSSQILIKDIPDDMPIILSTDKPDYKSARKLTDVIYTVSKYPAEEKDYDKFGDKLKKGLSDHTTSWQLYQKWHPEIYEVHFRLFDTVGNDAKAFARLPEQFIEMNKQQEYAMGVKEDKKQGSKSEFDLADYES
jgi:sialic acid synthase SpsE